MSSPMLMKDYFSGMSFGGMKPFEMKRSESDYKLTGIDAETSNRFRRARTDSKAPLPSHIDNLIDNKGYRNRVRYLIRTHGIHYIEKCAELARTKAKPSHWFATAVISVKNWKEKTLQMLESLFHTEGVALNITESLGETAKKFTNYLIGAIGFLGLKDVMIIVGRAKKADNPEHYLFGALRQAIAEAKQV